MAAASWSPQAPGPSSLTLKVGMGILAVPILVVVFLLGQSKRVEAQAWPVIHRVALRLQTDAEAERLYRANPALAKTYPTVESFLEPVRAYRPQFASLPGLPPKADRYECHAGPNGFRASVQGSGGSWVILEVRQDILFEKVPGEGLLRLAFSPTREPSGRERRARRKARAESR